MTNCFRCGAGLLVDEHVRSTPRGLLCESCAVDHRDDEGDWKDYSMGVCAICREHILVREGRYAKEHICAQCGAVRLMMKTLLERGKGVTR